MACNKKIANDILFDCADAPKKGLDGSTAVLINMDDIDRAASTESGATITDLILKAGTTGYKLDWYKELASSTATYNKSTEDYDGFGHGFLCRLATTSAKHAEDSAALKNGRFVVVYLTNYGGTDNADKIKVGGWETGLEASEIALDTNANSSSITFTLSTRESMYEEYPYHVYLKTDYATSKAEFDGLFAPGV